MIHDGLTWLEPEVIRTVHPMPFLDYHRKSMEVGDVDPSYSMLRYLCERFELNTEQRYWLAFLYATCYCGPTVYYIYNEFPDFENVDEGRLERWWTENRSKLYFQTDKRWIRSRNQWCDVFRSYKAKVGNGTQEQMFNLWRTSDERMNYQASWANMEGLYQFGRFAMFLYLEAVHVVTDYPMRPHDMDIVDAESCRNGLAYALEKEELVTKGRVSERQKIFFRLNFKDVVKQLETENPRNNIWNIETTLCAYKKYRMGKRYIGYYIERQAEEIRKMQGAVTEGVDWDVLWQYREETFDHDFLKEKQ